jgi:hypothetical protein
MTKSSITDFDDKGRPGPGPRPHHLPPTAGVVEALAEFGRGVRHPTAGGRKTTTWKTLAGWNHDLVGTSIDGFQGSAFVPAPSIARSEWHQP